jgi:FkbM family methyltransferase
MNLRGLLAHVLFDVAKFMTRESGNIEQIYQSVDRLGLLWKILMRVMLLLNIDRVILAPAGSKLVPIPLFMSSSERSVLNIFKPKAGDIVVDVGTYYGRYTIMASEYVGDSGLVVGIEADSNNYCIARKNVEINKIKNVILLWSAASNHEGTIKLYKTERPGTPSIVWDARTVYENVRCNTIDKLLKDIGVTNVDWLKIDVEGAELFVLEGSQRTLTDNKELKLVIEIHTNSNAVFKFLERLGYRTTLLEKNKNLPFHILAAKKKQDESQ